MNVKLLAHTQLSESFYNEIIGEIQQWSRHPKDGQVISHTAIRCCYSPNKPTEIIGLEGKKYFDSKATDGKSGTEADRLFRHITGSGHQSTLEHLNYTFAIEGVSRALMAQLTRHRHLSFSIKSQRYVRFGSNDKSGGFGYVVPETVKEKGYEATNEFDNIMASIQQSYDRLRQLGVPSEDSRSVLPNAATTDIVMTGNLRTLLDFYSKRKPGSGAQQEIAQLADGIKNEILKVDEWLAPYFENSH
ncbi:FAD-dependent thymidylate synthase [Paenibacillus spiritus]|uniref:FAD-dependent thymidylate synthase n=1 Tax=Paenibacillus spiritus TaxID=2496557 RepID=A0A5J5GHN5_9BACL|nr:FAD-dependent thymidylate synthase [Paenibacillus spiritus]KAA9007232.1 FAD-dependent thymidylate synthase [Paenibacillus spiritus]